MSGVELNISLTFNKRDIDALQKAILQEVTNEIFLKIQNNKTSIERQIGQVVRKNLLDSPEVQSLTNDTGKLRVELGLIDSDQSVNNIIDYITSNIKINVSRPISSKNVSEIATEIYIDGSYSDLYSQSYAYYTTKSGAKIEWLRWLIEAGNKDVVFGYKIVYGVGLGRTGHAVMLPTKSANWRVPPEFSGVEVYNFITRSFDGVETEMSNIIGGIL